jgi:hypothetical protein
MKETRNVEYSEGGDLQQIVHFLEEWSQTHHANLAFLGKGARYFSPDLIALPTVSGDSDLGAYERAEIMQRAEEAWNYQEPAPHQQILLVPSRPRRIVENSPRKGKRNHAIQ